MESTTTRPAEPSVAAASGEARGAAPPRLAAVVLRALLYALAVAVLVVFAPAREHVFIYQGF